MQPTLAKELVMSALALQMALRMRQPASGLLHHSDRGSQYASNEYQQLLKQDGFQPSMSRKGNGPQIRLGLSSVMIMLLWRVSLLP